MIDSIINKLKAYNDKGLSEKLYGNNAEIAKLVSPVHPYWLNANPACKIYQVKTTCSVKAKISYTNSPKDP